MTELDQARAICRHLDHGAEHVSLRVQARLAAARDQALKAMPALADRPSPSVGLARQAGDRPAANPSLWWRLGAAATPVLLVLAALVIGDAAQQDQRIEELAEVDAALLTDDVPLMAYADHGFGVYLMNTRR